MEKLGAVFNQVAFPLQYTPRKFVIHPETNNLILIETDHNAYTEATKAQRKQQMAEVGPPQQQGALWGWGTVGVRHLKFFAPPQRCVGEALEERVGCLDAVEVMSFSCLFSD